MPLGLEDDEANITKAQRAGKSLKNHRRSPVLAFFRSIVYPSVTYLGLYGAIGPSGEGTPE